MYTKSDSKTQFVTTYEALAASATKGHEPIVSQNSPFLLSHQEMSACHPATRTGKTASSHFTNSRHKHYHLCKRFQMLPALPFDQFHQAFPSKKNGMV